MSKPTNSRSLSLEDIFYAGDRSFNHFGQIDFGAIWLQSPPKGHPKRLLEDICVKN